MIYTAEKAVGFIDFRKNVGGAETGSGRIFGHLAELQCRCYEIILMLEKQFEIERTT